MILVGLVSDDDDEKKIIFYNSFRNMFYLRSTMWTFILEHSTGFGST